MDSYASAKLYFIAVLLYCASLFTHGFSTMEQSVLGISILLAGWSQAVLAITLFFNTFEVMYLFLALPWCSNIFMLTSFLQLRLCTNEQLCSWAAHGGVICTVSFLLNPKVLMGETISLIDANIEIGGLLWCMSSFVILYLFYQLRKLGCFRHCLRE